MNDRLHVTPRWEHHEPLADCWCEPTITENGKLVIHHARTCKGGGVHKWTWRPVEGKNYEQHECEVCGQESRAVVSHWPQDRDERRRET